MVPAPCPGCVALEAQLASVTAEVTRLRDRKRPGPAPAPPGQDPRSQLIYAAATKSGLSHSALAERLGINVSRLSPSGTFPAHRREEIEAKLHVLAAGGTLPLPVAPTSTPQRRRRRQSRLP